MEFECIYNPELDTVEGVTRGKADVETFLEMLNRVLEICGQQEAANIVIDHSYLDAESLSMANIETLGRKAASKKGICKVRKCAHVVTNDLQFGLVRGWEIIVSMYELSDLKTQVFRSRDDATEWIKTSL
jgi:hypothetical protein